MQREVEEGVRDEADPDLVTCPRRSRAKSLARASAGREEVLAEVAGLLDDLE